MSITTRNSVILHNALPQPGEPFFDDISRTEGEKTLPWLSKGNSFLILHKDLRNGTGIRATALYDLEGGRMRHASIDYESAYSALDGFSKQILSQQSTQNPKPTQDSIDFFRSIQKDLADIKPYFPSVPASSNMPQGRYD